MSLNISAVFCVDILTANDLTSPLSFNLREIVSILKFYLRRLFLVLKNHKGARRQTTRLSKMAKTPYRGTE